MYSPEIINQSAESFASQCIVAAIDALRRPTAPGEPPSWELYINGGRKATGIDALEWVEALVDRGAGELVLNSIDADGTRAGYDLELNQEVARRVDVPIVASGGAGNLDHIHEVLTTGRGQCRVGGLHPSSLPALLDSPKSRAFCASAG